MKVLHLAAGNRWTGAAAPAFAEVEALRAAGVDAHYAYVGGYKLEAKLAGLSFAHPLIAKAQNPVSFLTTARAIGRLVDEEGFEIIHSHLTYDHWLAGIVTRGRRIRIARTFHSSRTLRSEPLTKALMRRTPLVFVVNDTFARAGLLRRASPLFTPPPVDLRQFKPAGPDVRAAYGLAPDDPLLAVIGKLSKGRGFEDAIRTFAAVRTTLPAVKLMIIGHGEHRPALEALSRELGVSADVIWAGYHEDDLAEHYRAADALLFTAAGSDEGHRAVIEAMACGVPPAAFPLPGIAALLGPHAEELLACNGSPGQLASLITPLLMDRARGLDLAAAVVSRAAEFGYDRASARLLSAYQSVD